MSDGDCDEHVKGYMLNFKCLVSAIVVNLDSQGVNYRAEDSQTSRDWVIG